MKPRYPSLRFKAKGQYYFTWDAAAKKKVYLGKDKARARERYDQLVQEEATRQKPAPDEPVSSNLSVNELLLKYLRHRQDEEVGVKALNRLKAAIRFTKARGLDPAASFRALALQNVRQKMLAAPNRQRRDDDGPAKLLSRRYVNTLVGELKRAWTWAASLELVPAETAASLSMVKNLRLDKGGAELKRVAPASPAAVDATLPALSPVTRAMVEVHRLAGMRPGELCRLRPCDVSTAPDRPVPLPGTDRTVAAIRCGETVVWLAVPGSHKNTWRGKPRAIVLGPRCQEILRPFLDRDPRAPLFSPREAADWFRDQQDQAKVYASARPPAEAYTPESYCRAVARAIGRINRDRLKAGLEPIRHWSPNQLRHSAGSAAAEAIDRGHAQAFLGHSGIDALDVYVEQELSKAARVAAKIG